MSNRIEDFQKSVLPHFEEVKQVGVERLNELLRKHGLSKIQALASRVTDAVIIQEFNAFCLCGEWGTPEERNARNQIVCEMRAKMEMVRDVLLNLRVDKDSRLPEPFCSNFVTVLLWMSEFRKWKDAAAPKLEVAPHAVAAD